MKKTSCFVIAAAALAAACTFADTNCQLPTTNNQPPTNQLPTISSSWKVPNWTTIVTEPSAVQKWVGKIWSGHCQGMCVSSNALYFSFHDQIVKTDWYGREQRWVQLDVHGGDICIWNGKQIQR